MERILVAMEGLTEEQKSHIRSSLDFLGEVRFAAEKQEEWRAALQGATIVFGWPEPEALFHSEVRFLQLPSSGYDAYRAPVDRCNRAFLLANARGIGARAVAEHCTAMMFAFARGIPVHLRQQAEHRWRRAERYGRLLGAQLCIIGMGAIGQTLAAMARALGMRVIAVTRNGAATHGADDVFALSRLREALAIADHAAIVLPALPGNQLLMGAREFAAMKRGSYLYSLGRGSHIDYSALREALHLGYLAGAGLDVFAQEPLLAEDPLWDEPNVLISPHAAGRFSEEMDDLIALFLTNTLQFVQGRALQNVVIHRPGPEGWLQAESTSLT